MTVFIADRDSKSDRASGSARDSSVELIRSRWPRRPVVGLVLGSGLGCLVDAVVVEAVIEARDVPGMPVSTAIGHRGRFVCGTLSGVPVIVQDGRLHSYEGHDAATCAWPVRLMIRLGIQALVVTNASGGVNPDYSPGDVMLIDDHINLMWSNPLIGPNDDRFGPRFPDMSAPYDGALADAMRDAARSRGDRLHRGVYLALAGPNYETPAEYRMARKLGADVVGMSTVPEVLTARHAGVRVLGISIVANVFRPDPGSGAGAEPEAAAGPGEGTTGEAVVAQVAQSAPRVAALIEQVVGDEWGRAGRPSETPHQANVREEAAALARQNQRLRAGDLAEAAEHSATAALLTADGRGAVAVIRVVGPPVTVAAAVDHWFRAANGRVLTEQPAWALCYGHWGGDAVSGCEDVVVCRSGGGPVERADRPGRAQRSACPVPAELSTVGAPPAASTVDTASQADTASTVGAGVEHVEIHCHGGPAAVERILSQLQQSGVRRVDWRTQRPGEESPLDVECAAALAAASTERAAMILLRQSRGLLRTEIDSLAAVCRQLLPVEGASRERAAPGTGSASDASDGSDGSGAELGRRLRQLVARSRLGIHLAEPWRVVLTGRPNVGKSTLLNTLLGYSRAIVFDAPGTTRDVVTGETAFEGWPFLLSDTAGVRHDGNALEQEGIRRIRRLMDQADLVCLLFDASVPPTDEDRRLLERLSSSLEDGKLLPVAHKSDQPNVWGEELPAGTLPVSSRTGEGVRRLVAEFLVRLVGTGLSPEVAVPVTRRQAMLLSAALEAVDRGEWEAVLRNLLECRDGYRPDEAAP